MCQQVRSIYPHSQSGLMQSVYILPSTISVVENISLHLAFSRLTQKLRAPDLIENIQIREGESEQVLRLPSRRRNFRLSSASGARAPRPLGKKTTHVLIRTGVQRDP